MSEVDEMCKATDPRPFTQAHATMYDELARAFSQDHSLMAQATAKDGAQVILLCTRNTEPGPLKLTPMAIVLTPEQFAAVLPEQPFSPEWLEHLQKIYDKQRADADHQAWKDTLFWAKKRAREDRSCGLHQLAVERVLAELEKRIPPKPESWIPKPSEEQPPCPPSS